MIKTLIFDWGGVLIEGDHTIAMINYFSKKYNVPVSKAEPYIRRRVRELDLGKLTVSDYAKKLNKKFNLNLKKQDIYNMFWDTTIENKKVMNLIKELSKKYKIVMLSNNCQPNLMYMKKRMKRMYNLFPEKHLSYKSKIKKPTLKFYKQALRNRNPEECIFIDDKKVNIVAAKKLKIKAIQFKNYTQLKKDLKNLISKNLPK